MAIERIHTGTDDWTRYYGNHIARYRFAASLVPAGHRGKILDIACGVGYGAKYIADNLPGAEVFAVDRSGEAIREAESQFNAPNLTFVESDVFALPDAITKNRYALISCFETLEHLSKPLDFLRHMRQLLEPSGILVISTPNLLVTKHSQQADWLYHETEYTPEAFFGLLKETGLVNVELYGQELTQLGKLRNEMRHELNVIHSNVAFRFGKYLQKKIRKRRFTPPLPEQASDFEINPFSHPGEMSAPGENGPMVLVAVGRNE